VAPGEALTRKTFGRTNFHGWCRPQVRQECAVERLAAFGLAAVEIFGRGVLARKAARVVYEILRRCHWVTRVKSGGDLPGWFSVGSVGARTTKKKLPSTLPSALTYRLTPVIACIQGTYLGQTQRWQEKIGPFTYCNHHACFGVMAYQWILLHRPFPSSFSTRFLTKQVLPP
jgi:hypothetical protein